MLRKRALALTAVLALGLIPTLPSYAVTTYASPADLIEDVVEVALTGVTSPTKGDALTEMKGKITLTGDEVFYDGTSIGYWYSEDSSTIYTTEAQADTVVVSDGSNGWEVEPLIFEDILSDVNEDLIENVVPTTADWSKIIGKYDVTLGSVTIPADQWIEITPSADPIGNGTTFAFSDAKDVITTDHYLCAVAYAVHEDGSLYLQNDIHRTHIGADQKWETYRTKIDGTDELIKYTFKGGGTYTDGGYLSTYPVVRLALSANRQSLIYSTTYTLDNWGCINLNASSLMYKVGDATVQMSGDSTSFTKSGIAYFFLDDVDIIKNNYYPLFVNPSSSKKVVGNTMLTKRLSKLSNLTASDTIVFTASGWTVNGLEDLDSYISTSILTEAGQSATMDGAVEIEELNFKVVVPSTLPMVADSEGNVQVASNASIDNKSNAKVKITGLEIEANSESGWTMVDSNPSKTRGDNEFSFGTSLSIGDEIAKGDALEFTYNADLSPAEQGVDSVDLVTLTITLDWAE